MSELRNRLLEPVIMEAVADGRITDTELAKRLVHERAEAAKEIERLSGVLSDIKARAERQPDFDIGDAWFMAREALQEQA